MERENGKCDDIKRTVLSETVGESDLYYNVEDRPPIGVTLFFGIQLVLANICFCIMLTIIIQELICADQNFAITIFSSITFMSGLTTIMQSYFGVRMPVFQGPSPVWIMPYLNAKRDSRWGCHAHIESTNSTALPMNITEALLENDRPWEAEWAKVAGSMMLAMSVEMFLAATGLISLLSRLIRPVAICVIFILIGVYCQAMISDFTRVHWGMSFVSIALVLIFSQYINRIQVPLPTWTRKKGLALTRMSLFELFPVLLAVLICWVISAIVTAAGGFPDDETDIRYTARTDIHSETIASAPVFIFPHPGQFCGIDFSFEYFIMFLVPTMATIMESLGDYCQYALACCLPRPPAHAMNRGIFMEGLCGFFSALMGMGINTTSYSQIVGLIRITKVACRQVYGVAGVILMIVAVFGKASAVFVSIPRPVLAGPVFIAIALLVGSTFMNLKGVDLGKARNQTTLGCGIMIGIFVPLYFQGHRDEINTGSSVADRIIISVITTPFLVGGIVAIFLDNTIPGRSEDESKKVVQQSDATTLLEDQSGTEMIVEVDAKKKTGKHLRTYAEMMKVFDPPFISKYTRRWKYSRFIPMLPDPDPDEDCDVPRDDGDNETIIMNDRNLKLNVGVEELRIPMSHD